MSTPRELKHYGVKGMRWGVRKDQRAAASSKATTEKGGTIGRVGAKVQMTRYFAKGGRVGVSKKFDQEWYDKADTGKQFIEAGHKLNRVVRGVDENALRGRLYVAHILSDTEMYKATIPAVQNGFKYGKKTYQSVYQVELETKKRLSLPSEKERIDTFIETIQTKSGREWLKNNGYRDEVNELNAKEIGLKAYKRFNKYAGNQAVDFNNTYFNAIRKKGYNALIDDNDAGIWSKEPLILLTPKMDVKISSVKQLTAADINKAQRDVLKLREFESGKKP